jgi:hypothetical protein
MKGSTGSVRILVTESTDVMRPAMSKILPIDFTRIFIYLTLMTVSGPAAIIISSFIRHGLRV